MAANSLQPMPLFEPKADPTNTSARWTQWIERFNTFLIASNVKDNARKRALLLYQAGPEVHEIFKTLTDTGDDKDYEAAVNALTRHFEPDKNRIYQTYMFRQATQQENETIDEFHTRLRQLAKHCDFTDVEFEIKMQIVCNGTSSRLRKKALKERDYSLKDMLIDGRKSETSNAQASGMEEKFKGVHLNQIRTKSTTSTCYNCGFAYPHSDRPCPATNSTCNSCGILGHFSRVCRKKEPRRFSTSQQPPQNSSRQQQREHPKKYPKPTTTGKQDVNRARAVTKHSDSSTESDLEDDLYAYAVDNKTSPKTRTTVCVNSVNIDFIVDTGATVDVIDSKTYDRLKSRVELSKSTTKIFAYGSDKPLPLKGQFQATLESNKRYTVSLVYVVDGNAGNLLSAKTAQDLALIQLVNKVTELKPPSSEETSQPEIVPQHQNDLNNDDKTLPAPLQSTPKCSDTNIQNIIDKYGTVFQGEGKLNTQQIKLHINESVKPIVQPQRRIPYHMRQDVSKELKRLVEEDIIERVSDQPTPWISPIVCTPKKDGSTRICIDMREANQAIERERHIIPTLSDFRAEMNGSKYFSKIDLKQAYHQLELTEESRYITTFSTHDGLFRYKRLNYGTNSAAEIFQNVLQHNLSDIRGVKNIADDIIVHGKTRKLHDEALENCLKRLAQLNLKAKPAKCSFLQKEINFYGLIFTANGTRPDPTRIDNLVKVSAPKNAAEVRSFLGLANTCHEFVPEYAVITAPLRELTKKNAAFTWTHTHQKAFEQIKKKLTRAPTMAYFDTEKRSLLIVDGSPLGICAILAQREKSGHLYRIISYASRALSPVESRYSQTDIEGLSLVWGIEHFRLFLLGTAFDVYTDHKALEAIFNNPRSKPPARIERWMLRLQPYNFHVIYKKGTANEADYLSRHPVNTQARTTDEERMADDYVNYIVNNTVPKSMTLQEIKDATLSDTILKKVQECIKSGKWDEKDMELKPYRLCQEELTTTKAGDLILKGSRIIIPKALQDRATKLGHVGHQGIEKTKALLREKIWYPEMDNKVKNMVENCVACQAVGPNNPPEPMRITPTATEPWQSLAIDFYGPIPQGGQYLLVVTDTYSKFPEVEIVKSTSAKACIPKLDRIFATHGIPSKIKTDNGPPFNGDDFKRYTATLGIEWKTSTPLWPQGNGNAESIMKPIGKLIKASSLEGKNWRQELQRFLLNYRSTPHVTTKIPPCELLFNRKVQGSLPELSTQKVVNKHQKAKENIEKKKNSNKKYYDISKRTKASNVKKGDTVICQQQPTNKLSPRFNPERFTVIRREGATVTARNERRTITRNVSHFKVVNPVEEESNDDEKTVTNHNGHHQQEQETLQRRSTRKQRLINRFGNLVPSELIP